jgi:hypothetical protein
MQMQMLEEGAHPYQIEKIDEIMFKVVAYPCGRPGCPECGGTGN